ncbi:MAG: SapB/AmfS family lanthipeptide [Pseudonocardiaceae bacterium]
MALLDLQALELSADAPQGGRGRDCDYDCDSSSLSLLLCSH